MKRALVSFLLLIGCAVGAEMPVVVFDFGGVLGGTDKTVLVEELEVCFGISEKEAWEVLSELRTAKSQGQTAGQFWSLCAEARGWELPSDWMQYIERVRLHAIRANEEMYRLVAQLRQQKVQVAILSNVSPYRAKYIRACGLYDLFEPVLLSCEVGLEKPDEKIFLLMLDRIGKEPNQCIFIDDKLRNIRVAKQLGMDTIHFRSPSQLKEELCKREVLHCS